MKNFKKILFLSSIAACVAFGSTHAEAQSRKNKRVGFGVGLLGDPAPSLLSYQLKFNLSPRIQLMGSYGSIKAGGSSVDPNTGVVTSGSGGVTSFGASARAFLIPSWSLSPFVGAAYSHTKMNGSFSLSGETISSAKKNLSIVTASAGLDHQAYVGFNIGVGVNYFFTPAIIKDHLPILPYFYAAWFLF